MFYDKIKYQVAHSLPKNKQVGIYAGAILLALIVFGAIYYYFNLRAPQNIVSPTINSEIPSTQVDTRVPHPLTGELFEKKDSEAWDQRSPISVILNNAVPARPQSGLTSADLVYEIVAEGGITRFLAFFSSELPEKVGPVRSARHYYLPWVKENGDATFAHIGWSPQALDFIEKNGVKSLGRAGARFWRDQARLNRGVATEHTAYMNVIELLALGQRLNWDTMSSSFRPYVFKDPVSSVADSIEDIEITFWDRGPYTAAFKYDADLNAYLRYMGFDSQGNPLPHLDNETQEQITVSNVVVQFALETKVPNDTAGRLEYRLVGSGEALVFLDGRVFEATWSKSDVSAKTLYYDTSGQEIQFNRGKFWISVVPDRNKDLVKYAD